MDYIGPLTYYLGGERIRISFTNPKVGLICQAFFHLSSTDEAEDYEIIFKEIDERSWENGVSAEKQILDCSGPETVIQVIQKDGFHIFFLPEQKKIFSCYPEGIFNESFNNNNSYALIYENSFNDEILPPNSSGVIATIYWLLECLGIFRLHAAYVEYRGMDIIFPGKGAVGKTTSALNVALNSGRMYCDDQVFFRKNRMGHIEVYPLIRKIAVTEKTMKIFPDLLAFRSSANKSLHKYHIATEAISSFSEVKAGMPDFIIFPSILDEIECTPRAEEISSYEGFVSFLKGEILYPPVSSENRKSQLDLLELLSDQAKTFFFYNCRDMDRNFSLFREIVSFKCISEKTVT